MKIKLAHLESRLQALIEGSAARLFPGYHQQTDLASRLIEAMQENMRARSSAQPGREPSAPNLFTLLGLMALSCSVSSSWTGVMAISKYRFVAG